MAVIYLLRRKKLEIALGIGAPIVLLGLIPLAIIYGLISGPAVWLITGAVLIILASFIYFGEKRNWPPK